MLNKTVSDYIFRHALLDKGRKYIVALSGGADSVALLLLLIDLGYTVEAAHCNFHLRGEESDRDEAFVKALCCERDIPLHLVHFDTREYAALHKVSIEMAARKLRYSWFEQLRRDIDAAAICVAHHRDDSVETFLINLLRGTGIHGLTGIRPANGNIIRPLLCVDRNQIVDYLAARGQSYVDDSTNFVDDVMRNKIRLNIIPRLREIAPNASESIQLTAERITEACKLFDHAVSNCVAEVLTDTEFGVAIDIPKLRSLPSPEYVLFDILRDYAFTPAQTEQIYGELWKGCDGNGDGACLNMNTGKMFSSSTHNLLFDRGRILIEPACVQPKPMRIPEEGTYVVNEEMKIRVERRVVDNNFVISRSVDTATLDADKVKFPLTVRAVKDGDRFVPFGMKGSKLVSDYLTDKKKTLFDKRRQMVVADASDNILWLVKERTDNRYRVESESIHSLVISIV